MSDETRCAQLRKRYGAVARALLGRAGARQPGCCGGGAANAVANPMTAGNYRDVPAHLGDAFTASLGCGNPGLLAGLSPGEDVLDLGSGGGLDVLLSATRVAPGGTAYGLDMTPEMIELAERHRLESGVPNARFLLGRIEQIPLADASIDVVISNCVLNLSQDKAAALREAYRVLRPGGRLAITDTVLLRPIPEHLQHVAELWTGCISGALTDIAYRKALRTAGFGQVELRPARIFRGDDLAALPDEPGEEALPAGMSAGAVLDALDGALASALIRARKPADWARCRRGPT